MIWKRNRQFKLTAKVYHSVREIIRTATICSLED